MCVRTVTGLEFEGLARELLSEQRALRFRAQGISMRPFIRHGDLVEVVPVTAGQLHRGDVVLCSIQPGRLLLHRVIRIHNKQLMPLLLIQGDATRSPDGYIVPDQVLGRVSTVWHRDKIQRFDGLVFRWFFWLWASISPLTKTFGNPRLEYKVLK